MRLRNSYRRPKIRGLDEHGKRQPAAGLQDTGGRTSHRHIIDDRQHPFLTDTLHHLLIHGDSRPEHARADVWQVGQLKESLHCPVLAERAMKYWEDDVDFGMGARFGHDRPRTPLTVQVDKEFDWVVLVAIQSRKNRLSRANRDFVFARASAVDHGYS